ncbi:cation diffusion facilitator family transporter [Aquibaculum sediminis]|uniref:cation diffusion facilitator family transporter n=1 Tax=Aquibaculum sediminis TaxID=3231907 RepID=UPI0034561F9C
MLGPAEQRREKAVGFAVALDFITLIPYAAVGILALSWPIIADSLRGALLIAVGLVSYTTLRRIHRRRLEHYEYGAGKLEQSITILIAGLLLLTAGVLLWRVAGLAVKPQPTGILATSAIAMAFMIFAVNGIQLFGLYRANRDGESLIVRAQYQARWVKTVASGLVTAAVTVAMLTENPEVARRADQIGTLCVIIVMAGAGIAMLRNSLPDLLDRSLPEPLQHGINRVLARNIDAFEQLGRVRTRRGGSVIHVEMELFVDRNRPLGEASDLAERIGAELAEEIPGVDPVVILRGYSGQAAS